MIASLGDHRLNNNVVSGFFTVSLVRASDGALLTNATGSDVIVNCVAVPDASAKEGKDFVFTNMHDLPASVVTGIIVPRTCMVWCYIVRMQRKNK